MTCKLDLNRQIRLIIFFCVLIFLPFLFFPHIFAHLEQNSSGGAMEGKFFATMGFEPRNPIQNTPTKILFSIQDKEGNHLENLQTMVEVYSTGTEKRLFLDSWNVQKYSDFEVLYNFKKSGTYQIVLSISEEKDLKEHVVPSRTILANSQSCNCTRMVFNVSVSEDLTNIWNSLIVIVVILPFSIFGFAMIMNYKNKRNSQKTDHYETLRYIVVLLAFAGGLVHLSIYVNHVPLRIEYGMFLLLAAITQIGFGVLYLAVLLSDSIKSQKEQENHKKRNQAICLFGIIGSIILLGLYTYVVNFPPPLSPENHPEEVELAGIIAKVIEISLIGILALVIRWETRTKNNHLLPSK